MAQSDYPIFLLSPLEEVKTLHFNKFDSCLPNDTLCQVWFRLTKWFFSRFKSCQMNVFSLCGYYLPMKNWMALHLNKFLLPKNTLWQVKLILAKRFLRRILSKCICIFLRCCYYLPWEKGKSLHLTSHKFPLPRDNLYQVGLKLAQWFWSKRFSKVVKVFSLCGYDLPLENAWPFIWTYLNPLYLRIHLRDYLSWYWPSGSWGVDFQVLHVCRFWHCCYYLPLENCKAHHLI